MNLEKRVEQLEHRIQPEATMILILAWVGCDPEKSGSERAIRREVAGYSASGRDGGWWRAPGESVEQLKARMQADVRSEGCKVYVVWECYDEETP